ncbi:glycosyltransferase family 2 protein [Nonomuraea endophytica]|uniref:Glycosyltransferase involved in cell wall biosynthesis n=1 Tax=Nonomuraea endophytica TaxID=714136 RepID=A0A7W7ZY90_9ACTN|nr:glycosyltransferase family 2 protein [Nonomuraea endophytica]MBB5075456.1 glycosyltransferase involved in cell wall biosynthesis [Nonomuraea endophytica]
MTVSIGLPVYNGAEHLAETVRSILAQDHTDIQLVISDNASTDGTQEICRELAAGDERVLYHRQPRNLGTIPNFMTAMELSTGDYFRWIGDDDRIEPNYVSRVLREFERDPRVILVTHQTAYTTEGVTTTARYEGAELGSDDPVERFAELLRLLTESYTIIDPLYGLMRRDVAVSIPRPILVREDELAAARYALAGPWAHVNEVLAARIWIPARMLKMSQRHELPTWRGVFANVIFTRELLRAAEEAGLDADQRRRARAAVYKHYAARQRMLLRRRTRRLMRLIPGM